MNLRRARWIWALMSVPAVLLVGCGAEGPMPGRADGGRGTRVRAPAVAGRFYEGTASALRAEVAGYVAKAKPAPAPGRLLAGVVPHAGYPYSGRCAGGLYGLVEPGRYERVVVIGLSHGSRFRGISLPAADLGAYATPLGKVPIDMAACDALRAKSGFVHISGADRAEHSLEVQLPFLQVRLGAFRLVPLVCGYIAETELAAFAEALVPLFDARTLVLASTDFTHYGPNYGFVPFRQDVRQSLYRWLDKASGLIAGLDLAGFQTHCRQTHDTICGRVPVQLLMAVLKQSGRRLEGRVLARYTSADVVGDYQNSVSYAAIGFFDTAAKLSREEGLMIQEHRSGEWSPELTDEEKQTLFAIARDTLVWCTAGNRGQFSFDAYAVTPKMQQMCATFVTLKKHGMLRGCIGSLEPEAQMYKSVHRNAVNAALRDPRFPQVRPDEVADLEIHVSLLSPIRTIPSIDEFTIGQHGIIIVKGTDRAVYLPEVAVEQGWNKEQTLSSLSMKAGMHRDAWREGTTYKVYESVVLEEK